MKIIVSGASGLIGTEICKLLSKTHSILKLTRQDPISKTHIHWDPKYNALNASDIDGSDAIIHLAGESLVGVWTKNKKANIRGSRVNSTNLLVNSVLLAKKRPKVFICASAVGFYGNCGEKIVTEDNPKGRGFLASVCGEWEKATDALKHQGIRVVNLRFGIVLSKKGGALKLMLPAFRLGLGGRIGSGNQFMSWISLSDAARAIIYCLDTATLSGPVNIVSPEPVTNSEFTKALSSSLKRPAFINLPEIFVRTIFGEMGEEMLLSSIRATPNKLLDSGFAFENGELLSALTAQH